MNIEALKFKRDNDGDYSCLQYRIKTHREMMSNKKTFTLYENDREVYEGETLRDCVTLASDLESDN